MKWQTIESAPKDKSVLLWWVGVKGARAPGAALTGQVSSYEPGMFWDGHIYRPIAWITHWMPLPPPPVDTATIRASNDALVASINRMKE